MFDYHIVIISMILGLIGIIVSNSNLKCNRDVGVALVVLALLFLLICGLICEATKPLKLNRSIPIVSLETQNTTKGNFILGCGSINENPVYYFYIKNKDGNYVLRNSNNIAPNYDSVYTELKLTDEEDPKIEIYENGFFL